MLDVFNELTWQFQVLTFEALLSISIAIVIAARGVPITRTVPYLFFSLTWDASALALFLTGGATTSWQHVLYSLVFIASILTAIYGTIKRKTLPVPDAMGGFVFFLMVYATCMILLLVGGR